MRDRSILWSMLVFLVALWALYSATAERAQSGLIAHIFSEPTAGRLYSMIDKALSITPYMAFVGIPICIGFVIFLLIKSYRRGRQQKRSADAQGKGIQQSIKEQEEVTKGEERHTELMNELKKIDEKLGNILKASKKDEAT